MANQRLNTTITIGGSVTAGLRSAIGSTVDSLRRIGSTIRDVQRQQRDVGAAIAATRQTGASVAALQRQYDALGASIDRMRVAQTRLANNQRATDRNESARQDYRSKIGETVALGIGAAGPIVMAAKFEKAMLGVAKQVDGARDDAGKLTQTYFDMAKQIQLLGRETPIATNELAEMVAAGARMGIAKDELIEFTKTSAMMASAFDLPAAELADNMGKIKTLFGLKTQAEVRNLADSINYLDDNAISKGGDIIEFMQRVGGVATAVKITGKEMAALGSTLLTLGERTETASTATNAIFQKFAAADKGTKKFKAAMTEIGLSTAKVQKGMQMDAQGTLLTVLEKIQKLPKEKQLGVMVELVGLEHSDTLAKLVGGIAEYRKQIDLANSQKAEGSMSREFEATRATTIAQWTMAKNRVVELGVAMGSVLLPAVNNIMGAIGPVVSKMAEWGREHPKVTQAVVGTIVAVTSLKVAAWAAGYAFTFVRGAVLATTGAFARAQAAIALYRSGALAAAVSTSVLGRAVAVAGLSLTALGRGILFALNPMNLLRAGAALASGAFVAFTAGARAAAASALLLGRAAIGGALAGVRALGAGLMAFAAAPVATTIAGAQAAGVALFGLARGGITAAIAGVRALSLAVVSNPIGIALTAIAVAGAAIYKYWEPLKAFFSGFGQAVADGLAPIGSAISAAFGPTVMSVLETIGGWLKSAIGWFGELLTPISAASETTVKFGEAGKVCGEVVAAAFTIMLAPIKLVLDSIKWINDNIGGVIDKASKLGGTLSDGWKATKAFVTGAPSPAVAPVSPSPIPAKGAVSTDAPAKAPTPAVAPVVATVSTRLGASLKAPAPADAPDKAPTQTNAAPVLRTPEPIAAVPPLRGASDPVNRAGDTNTINVYQQPGQDQKALADEVMRRMKQKEQIGARSRLAD